MNTTTTEERLDEDVMFESEGSNGTDMTDEELKIEALKIATNIGKLMSNVTTDDIVNIAETVAKFIKGGSDASLEVSDESESEDTDESEDTETEEEAEDFSTEESDETEESEESDETEESEDFEV